MDIFRTWKLIDAKDFPKVQTAYWRKLPYWVFTPVGLSLSGGIVLVLYHPDSSPVWTIWGNLACQILAIVLTAILWGQWQAKLSKDPLGSRSPTSTRFLQRIGYGRAYRAHAFIRLRGPCKWSSDRAFCWMKSFFGAPLGKTGAVSRRIRRRLPGKRGFYCGMSLLVADLVACLFAPDQNFFWLYTRFR